MKKVSRGIGSLFAAVLAIVAARAAGASDLFSSYDVVALRIEAPFNDLFTRAKQDADYTVDGTLRDTSGGGSGDAVAVKISLRGHTSRRDSECTFPKLKVESAGGNEPLRGGGKTIKIGTHCGESTDDTLTARFGRLPNERSPWREATVYRLLDALAVPALRARPARITYVFTDGTAAEGTPKDGITRNALLLEDEDAAITRLGGTHEVEAAAFTTADQMFSVDDSVNLAFAQALVGNFDWCVKFNAGDTYRCDARLKLWNVIGAGMNGGKARPLMYDFDVSGMVAGRHRWFPDVYNAAFVPSKSEREIEVISQLQRTRSLFDRATLDAARRRFAAKKSGAYRALEQAELDADGRRHIQEYLDAFFNEIETDDRFYRPVVTAEKTMLRADASPSAQPTCASGGPIPVGTPVSAPLESRNGMVKVVVLDALWHWAPAHCAIVQRGTPWIEEQAIGRNFPPQSP